MHCISVKIYDIIIISKERKEPDRGAGAKRIAPGVPFANEYEQHTAGIICGVFICGGEIIAKLTPKQERFCEEYLVDLNATQSYLRAGYKASNPSVARIEAHKLLTKPNIQKKISQLQENRSERTGVSSDDVIRELKSIAFAETDITEKGKMKALELLGKHLGIWDKTAEVSSAPAEVPQLYKALEGGDDE